MIFRGTVSRFPTESKHVWSAFGLTEPTWDWGLLVMRSNLRPSQIAIVKKYRAWVQRVPCVTTRCFDADRKHILKHIRQSMCYVDAHADWLARDWDAELLAAVTGRTRAAAAALGYDTVPFPS